jgi:hypothetical protein
MMLVALSPDAKGHLDHYLKQIRMALSGQDRSTLTTSSAMS